MPYITQTLDSEALKKINADKDWKEALETIKVLSNDFTEDDPDALDLDNMIFQWLNSKKEKPKPTPKKPVKKPRSMDEYPKWERELTDHLIRLLDISNGDAQGIIEANENFVIDFFRSHKTALETAKTFLIQEEEIEIKTGQVYEILDSKVMNGKKGDLFKITNISNNRVETTENGDFSIGTFKNLIADKVIKLSTKEPKKLPKKEKTKEELIKELLEQLEGTQKGNVTPEQVQIIVENILNSRKICFDDLCKDVVDLLKTTTNIKVHIPNMNTQSFKNDIPNLLKIIDDVILGNNVMLIGGAGTGKTFLAEKVASILGLETEVINCNQFTSPIEINGGQTIEGYQEGKLIKAWSEGKLLILDELPKLDPNTAGILNEALAKTGIDEKSERAFIVNTRGDRFRKKQGFGVIATGNVYPNTESTAYGANNKQDLSLLDRFGGSVYEIEKNPEFEKKVILPKHLFIWVICDTMRSLIEKNKWEAQVSIRLMETSLKVYLSEMMAIKAGTDMKDRKTFKDVIDSFIWTFTEVQQVEIKRAIKYTNLFENFQYRKLDIDKNPL